MKKGFCQWRRNIKPSKYDTNNHYYDDTNFPLSLSVSYVLQSNLLAMQASTSWASTLVWLPSHKRIDVTYDSSHTASNYEISISVIGEA